MPWTLVPSERVALGRVSAGQGHKGRLAGAGRVRRRPGPLSLGLSLVFRTSPPKVRFGMAGRIEDDFMSAEYDGRVIATAQYSSHEAADGQGAWIVSGLPRRLFTGTRRSRRWCSRSGSPQASATMICSSLGGVKSWGCDGPAHQDHHGAGGDCRGGSRRGHFVPARVRAGALERGVWSYGAVAAVHGGRADLGRIHGGTGRQPPGPAGTTAGGMEPGHQDRGHGRRQPGARGGTRAGRGAGQRVARAGPGWLIRAADDADPHRARHAGR